MSKSFAKSWRFCSTNNGMKRHANKVLKNIDDIPSGNAYKRIGMNTWNINDAGRSKPLPKDPEWSKRLARK